ncbi:MAG: tetratricopeptide repeat protein [Verrucomicrobiota bacterium]
MKANPTALRGMTAVLALASAAGISHLGAQDDPAALKEKVATLEARVSELESKAGSEKKLERLREDNKTKARNRASEDSRHYKPEELADIETLYQVANRNWRSDEARASLKKLLDKYDKSNRTGCATLYMGQMSEGRERIEYLTRAVEKFSDCYYLDGCQVGGYGRLVLALTLWQNGEKDKAAKLLAELKTKYRDSTDHKGRPMSGIAEAAEKELAAKP